MTLHDPKQFSNNPPADPDNLQPVVYAENEFAAETKAAVLKDEGIEAFVFANVRETAGVFAMGGGVVRGVAVWVRHADVDRARDILRRRIADSVDLDWSGVDVGAPNEDVESDLKSTTPLLARIALAVAITIVLVSLLAAVLAFLASASGTR